MEARCRNGGVSWTLVDRNVTAAGDAKTTVGAVGAILEADDQDPGNPNY